MVDVFGTLISVLSCILANYCAKLFCPWKGGGGTYLKAGANLNVYSTCVPIN